MRRFLLMAAIACCILPGLSAKPAIQQVEPLCWWTNMSCPLTLMLHGTDLRDAEVSIQQVVGGKVMRGQCLGLVVRGQHNAESDNYLFVDLDVREVGTYRITLKKGSKKATCDYTILEREAGSRDRLSFSSADMIYLIMSDRFVDGDESNNTTKFTQEAAAKDNIHGRWGGDIQGIINSLDHISELGATAIWPTPLLEDNEAAWSYHGYACSDYYHIDPRFGSNDLYKQMVARAHEKGIKVLMDMVPNHCGGQHWWIKDLPYHDWINQFPEFTNTINQFTANYDINASEYDRQLSNRGWFDRPMPDMNLENPDLLQYFKQWAIWWIEFANLDGLRVDTYPYIEKMPASEWCKAIRNEYPNINIVGECWTRPASAVAYWQADVRNFDGFNSNLPSVMDFPTAEAIRGALADEGKGWGRGLTAVYESLTNDYQYADVNKLLLFLDNHDMDRINDVVMDKDPRRTKIAYALLATMRGIPQVLYANEYDCHSADLSMGHSTLRMPLPSADTLHQEQKDMFEYMSRLFQWRKSEPIIHHGRTMHFLSRDNTYAFFRYTDEGAVFVFANASSEAKTIPTTHYKEMLSRYQAVGENVLSREPVDLNREDIVVEPLSTLIVRLNK